LKLGLHKGLAQENCLPIDNVSLYHLPLSS